MTSLRDEFIKCARSDAGDKAMSPLVLGLATPAVGAVAYAPVILPVSREIRTNTTNIKKPLSKQLLQIAKKRGYEVKIDKALEPSMFAARDRRFAKKVLKMLPDDVTKEVLRRNPTLKGALVGDLTKDLISLTPGTGPAIIAHELGHAKPGNFLANLVKTREVRQMSSMKGPVALGAAAIAGIMYRMAKTDEGKDTASGIAAGGAIASAALALPILSEEARADINAIKMLRKKGWSWKDVWKKGKPLWKAQVSYPLALTLPLGVFLGSLAMRPKKKTKGEE